MDVIELSRLIENLIKVGTIHSVDLEKKRARVQSGKLVTQWLRWFERRCGETQTWDPPTIGEQCIVLSPSGEPANGLIIYGAPSDEIDTPSHAANEHVIKFPDGATFTYDHAASHLAITGIKTATIAASERITHDTPLTHMLGQCIVDQLLTYGNGLAGTGGANGNTITGPINHEGDYNHSGGKMTSNGVVADEHEHEGVIPGSGISGGPVK